MGNEKSKEDRKYKEKWDVLQEWLEKTIRRGSVGDPLFEESAFYDALKLVEDKMEALGHE